MFHMDDQEPNIILIILDTLRYEGFNKYEKKLSSYDFIKYTKAYSTSPWTIPSHVSLFTGLYPNKHSVHISKDHDNSKLIIKSNLKKIMLNNVLRKRGYHTILISSNYLISPEFGYDDFDEYYNTNIDQTFFRLSRKEVKHIHLYMDKNMFLFVSNLIRKKNILKTFIKGEFYKFLNILVRARNKWPTEKGSNNVIKIIKKKNIVKPLFLVVNLMEPHAPHTSNDDISDKNHIDNIENNKTLNFQKISKMKKGYKKNIDYCIEQVFILLDKIGNKINLENSIVILTSDHGELLGEYNRVYHQIFLYDEIMKIPLYIKPPKKVNFIEKKNNDEYISIKNIYYLILNMINKKEYDENKLYSEYVIGESFGTTLNISQASSFNDYRIRVKKNNLDATFNVNKWKFDKLNNNNNKEEARLIILRHLSKMTTPLS